MEGGFKESALRLNGFVVKQTEWTESTIKTRAKLLAEKAKKIWAFPKMTDAELAPYRTNVKPAERYSLDSYDINVLTKTLFDVLDRRIQNLLLPSKENSRNYMSLINWIRTLLILCSRNKDYAFL